MKRQNIATIGPWPGSSPDLNIIENCWAVIKKKVSALRPTSVKDLINKFKVVWCQEISSDYCKKLAHSMPQRIAAVLEARGGPTKY